MADSIIPTLFSKGLNFNDNMNFAANNIKLSNSTIASISQGSPTTLKTSTDLIAADPLIGFTIYKSYSIFVFKKEILIYARNVETSFTKSGGYSFVDFTIFYNYLLAFQADGTFFWVDMENVDASSGSNATLASDITFLPSSVTIVSVTAYLGFLIFSMSDNYLRWTKARITLTPDDWVDWASNGDDSLNLSSAQYTYFLGEPVQLAPYSNVIGIGQYIYSISFVVVENYVSLQATRMTFAYGKNQTVLFTSDYAVIVGDTSIKIYKVADGSIESIDFINIKVSIPCLRSLFLSMKLTRISDGVETYLVTQPEGRMYLDGYIFTNGSDNYKIVPDNTGNNLYFFLLDVNLAQMSEYYNETLLTIGPTSTMKELIYTPASVPDSTMSFDWNGTVVAPVFDIAPNSVIINKVSNNMGTTLTEQAEILAGSYPYVVFRGRSPKATFSFTFDGFFSMTDLVIQ
jgi:hypothetical protein